MVGNPRRLTVGASLFCALIGCRASPAVSLPRRSSAAAEPAWSDALPPAPTLLLMIRPRALQADRVYGPVARRVLERARQRRVPSGTLILEAIEDCDEVVVDLEGDLPDARERSTSQPDDMVLALLGVRADIDPARLVGDTGEPLWSPGPAGPVQELVHERDADGTANPASLFELQDRTWVVAAASARSRVRETLLRPARRPAPAFSGDALAAVRIDGQKFADRAGLRGAFGPLAKVGHGLTAVTFDLLASPAPRSATERPSDAQATARARLDYASPELAATAASILGDMAKAMARLKPAGLDWLGGAEVGAQGSSAFVRAPIPAEVISSLLATRGL